MMTHAAAERTAACGRAWDAKRVQLALSTQTKSVQVGAKDGRNAKEGLLHERERDAHTKAVSTCEERAGIRERATAVAQQQQTAAA